MPKMLSIPLANLMGDLGFIYFNKFNQGCNKMSNKEFNHCNSYTTGIDINHEALIFPSYNVHILDEEMSSRHTSSECNCNRIPAGAESLWSPSQ
jgi:hypothetical protein